MVNIGTALKEEINEIIWLADYVFRDFGNNPTMGWQFPTMFSPKNADSLYIAEADGRIVSSISTILNTAVVYGHSINMASLGAVCTHPEYQGKGIGTKLLLTAFDDLKKKKAGIVTISGNRGLYIKNKAVNQGNYVQFEIGDKDLDCISNDGISFEYLTDSNATEKLSKVYVKEPVRYVRKVSEFPTLFTARPMVLPNETNELTVLTAKAGNEELAYIIGHESGAHQYKIVEYAGERTLIPFLIHEMHKLGFHRIQLEVPDYDTSLIELLKIHSVVPSYEGEMHTTIRITNREVLLQQLTPILLEVYGLSQKEVDVFTDSLPEDDGECAKVLFDRKYENRKQDVWNGAVPLPWPNGLNFI